MKAFLDDKLIEHSPSPYNSPLPLVKKKSSNDKQKWRFVVNYQKLNIKLASDKLPLTRQDDVLDKLDRARLLSTLYTTSSFLQKPLQDSLKSLTAFLKSPSFTEKLKG